MSNANRTVPRSLTVATNPNWHDTAFACRTVPTLSLRDTALGAMGTSSNFGGDEAAPYAKKPAIHTPDSSEKNT